MQNLYSSATLTNVFRSLSPLSSLPADDPDRLTEGDSVPTITIGANALAISHLALDSQPSLGDPDPGIRASHFHFYTTGNDFRLRRGRASLSLFENGWIVEKPERGRIRDVGVSFLRQRRWHLLYPPRLHLCAGNGKAVVSPNSGWPYYMLIDYYYADPLDDDYNNNSPNL